MTQAPPELTEDQRKELEEKLKNMSPEEIAQLQKQQCIFCQIIEGKIPSKKVYEDDKCIAVLDINPAAKGHILLLPKEHYAIMPQIPDKELGHFFRIARHLSQVLLKGLKVSGTSLFIANGIAAGQRAQHFMIHLIPRKEGDGLLPLEEKYVDKEMQQKVYVAIEAKINELLSVNREVVNVGSKDTPAPKLGVQKKKATVDKKPVSPKKEENDLDLVHQALSGSSDSDEDEKVDEPEEDDTEVEVEAEDNTTDSQDIEEEPEDEVDDSESESDEDDEDDEADDEDDVEEEDDDDDQEEPESNPTEDEETDIDLDVHVDHDDGAFKVKVKGEVDGKRVEAEAEDDDVEEAVEKTFEKAERKLKKKKKDEDNDVSLDDIANLFK